MTSQLPIQIANSFYSSLACTYALSLWKTFRHPRRYCKILRQTRSILGNLVVLLSMHWYRCDDCLYFEKQQQKNSLLRACFN